MRLALAVTMSDKSGSEAGGAVARRRNCQFPGCPTMPSFALKGDKAAYCSQHKLEDMVNVREKACEEPNCRRSPVYGFIGTPQRYCSQHMTRGMINLKGKKCKGCKAPATHAHDPNGKPVYCANHMLEGMVACRDRTCETEGCSLTPSFGFKNEKIRFCAQHKLEGMVNNRGKNCGEPGCTTIPNYGRKGSGTRYCAQHKQPDMLQITQKTCEAEDCHTLPSFGFRGEKPRYCGTHRQENMINVNKKICDIEGCQGAPNFGYKNSRKRFCIDHKTDDMMSKESRYRRPNSTRDGKGNGMLRGGGMALDLSMLPSSGGVGMGNIGIPAVEPVRTAPSLVSTGGASGAKRKRTPETVVYAQGPQLIRPRYAEHTDVHDNNNTSVGSYSNTHDGNNLDNSNTHTHANTYIHEHAHAPPNNMGGGNTHTHASTYMHEHAHAHAPPTSHYTQPHPTPVMYASVHTESVPMQQTNTHVGNPGEEGMDTLARAATEMGAPASDSNVDMTYRAYNAYDRNDTGSAVGV